MSTPGEVLAHPDADEIEKNRCMRINCHVEFMFGIEVLKSE